MNKMCYVFNLVLKKKYVLIYFANKLLLKQYYIRNKSKTYTLFFIYIYLFKFGFLNKNYKITC